MCSVPWAITSVNALIKNGTFHGPHVSFPKLFFSHILILYLGLNNAARIHTFPQENRFSAPFKGDVSAVSYAKHRSDTELARCSLAYAPPALLGNRSSVRNSAAISVPVTFKSFEKRCTPLPFKSRTPSDTKLITLFSNEFIPLRIWRSPSTSSSFSLQNLFKQQP